MGQGPPSTGENANETCQGSSRLEAPLPPRAEMGKGTASGFQAGFRLRGCDRGQAQVPSQAEGSSLLSLVSAVSQPEGAYVYWRLLTLVPASLGVHSGSGLVLKELGVGGGDLLYPAL